MNILAILGSPRENGSTGKLLNQYLLGVRNGHNDIKIDEIYLQNRDIRNCKGCNACQSEKSQCIIQDEMQNIYPLVADADVMIFATPVYVFNISAQLKGFLDRLHAVDYRIFKGKKIVLLTTYGDSEEENSGVQNVVNTIRMTAQMLEMDFVQDLNMSTYSLPIERNEEAFEKVYELGKNLVIKN